MTTSGILVTLPSSSRKSEFPNNKTSSYKIRLPYPLELNGKWEVGLSSITLPDTYLVMSILKDLNTFELKTVRNYIGDNQTIERCVSWNKKFYFACEVRRYQTFKCHHGWN